MRSRAAATPVRRASQAPTVSSGPVTSSCWVGSRRWRRRALRSSARRAVRRSPPACAAASSCPRRWARRADHPPGATVRSMPSASTTGPWPIATSCATRAAMPSSCHAPPPAPLASQPRCSSNSTNSTAPSGASCPTATKAARRCRFQRASVRPPAREPPREARRMPWRTAPRCGRDRRTSKSIRAGAPSPGRSAGSWRSRSWKNCGVARHSSPVTRRASRDGAGAPRRGRGPVRSVPAPPEVAASRSRTMLASKSASCSAGVIASSSAAVQIFGVPMPGGYRRGLTVPAEPATSRRRRPHLASRLPASVDPLLEGGARCRSSWRCRVRQHSICGSSVKRRRSMD